MLATTSHHLQNREKPEHEPNDEQNHHRVNTRTTGVVVVQRNPRVKHHHGSVRNHRSD